MSTTYLVTGGAGFIGSNFIRFLLDRDHSIRVRNLDLLTYAGVEATVAELDRYESHEFVHGDIGDRNLVTSLLEGVDVVVNFAAETHVDRSIDGPEVFLRSNVVGTGVLLDAARLAATPTFVHVSTDEVYGSVPEGFPTEEAPLAPSSPYAASKAAADLLVRSYGVTYGYYAMVTRCTNNYGPYQFPEKLIPVAVTNLAAGLPVPLYGDGLNERDWLYVEDHCSAIETVIASGTPGEIYNVSADAQMTNLELARRIVAAMGLDEAYIDYVPDRPGHDRRYALDSTKLRSLGWAPEHSLESRLDDTIGWYRRREDWWRPLCAEVT